MSDVSYAFERYEFVRREPSDIQEHLPTLVDLVVSTGATKVIELGVRWGVSTAAFLWALEQTNGHLWSVDTDNRCNLKDDRWTFLMGYDLDLGVMSQLPDDADIVFVDTDHRYDLTRAEIQAFTPKLRSGGYMVFHDTEVRNFEHHTPGTEPPFPVKKAVDELLPEDTYPRQHWTNNHGLTIVTMP